MATKEQIINIMDNIAESRPAELFRCVNETQQGIGAVLCLIYRSTDIVTAGLISEKLQISTARVAVLLKKMETKKLIKKERSESDARVTVVKLSELGEETFFKMHREKYEQIGNIIDTVGEERVLEFITIAREIKDIIKIPEFDL